MIQFHKKMTSLSLHVFAEGVDQDMVVLMAERASRLENQDAIDGAIVSMLADPIEAQAGIEEVHFLLFNPTDKRNALTYLDQQGQMHRVSKGARGAVPSGTKDSPGGPWIFIALLSLFDPPRHDSAETLRRALDLGVSVKMITGEKLAIAKETGRRLGMGTNMYPSMSLLGEHRDESISALPIDELIEKADGFAGVFPEHKYEIVQRLQGRTHICGMTGDGVNDAPALKKADIGIAVADATDAARSASDIVLTEPGLSVIISAVLTSHAIFQRMKNYTIYAVSITIRIVFPPFLVLLIAVLNDGTIMTLLKDRVQPSQLPDNWKLSEIFATGAVIGTCLALTTALFFWAASETNFFMNHFKVESFMKPPLDVSDTRIVTQINEMLASAVYLQVSTINQTLIFVTRSKGWSFTERPGLLLVTAFVIAQLVAFTSKNDFGREAREAAWATQQRSLHGLQSAEASKTFVERYNSEEMNLMADASRRRAENARIVVFNSAIMAAHKIAHATLKGPSVVKEICIGITLGAFAGGLWKMHHWNEQRKVRAFYDMLEKGEISVVAEEE
ncbi:hypothetical protein Sjap_004500 [Stephania japonica]|uniref:Uncharacterized protein n=1 Tax=Stephania japonica TaxID=461633 RepID=A0AAP0K2E4_9MAGN